MTDPQTEFHADQDLEPGTNATVPARTDLVPGPQDHLDQHGDGHVLATLVSALAFLSAPFAAAFAPLVSRVRRLELDERLQRTLSRHPALARFGPTVILLILILLVALNSFLAYLSARSLQDREQQVSHTHAVLGQLNDVLLALDDAETGQRGYVITGNSSYLQPYTAALKRVNQDLNTLAQVTADDALQQQRAAALRPVVSAKLDELGQTIDLMRAGKVEPAYATVASGRGEQLMNQIRTMVGQMQATENTLLATREAAAQRAETAMRWVFVLATLMDVALLAMVGWFVRRTYGQRERERLVREREQARADALALSETNRRMHEFLGVASHELKTPVTSLRINMQLAERRLRTIGSGSKPNEEETRAIAGASDLLQRSERSVERLVRLVDDLLDVSRIQAGKLALRPEPHDLLALVRSVVDEERVVNPERTITLDVAADVVADVAGGPLMVCVDADRIGQVLTNYLTNALKYSPTREPVVVQVRRVGEPGEADWARVSVRDHGPGLPPEEIEAIWEPFHRAPGINVLSGSGVGLGLGLAISKTIVERHGGEVGVQSVQGEGSVFWFTLPLTPPSTG